MESHSIFTTNEEKQAAPTTPKNAKQRSILTSIGGAMTHSMTWLRGESKDTVRNNPLHQHASESISEETSYHIYCIHGTADRSYAFNAMINKLLKPTPSKIPAKNLLPASIATIHLLAFSGRAKGNSIAFYAEQLKSKIIKNKHKNVIIMGHSRGGLIAAKFTEDMATDAGITVHGVITFCPPLDGSPLAKAPFTLAHSVSDMKHNSVFLQSLRPAIAQTNSEKQKYFFFGAENDSIVPIERTYIKEGCHSVILLPRHGHLSILRSTAVAEYVSDCLHIITKRPIAVQANPDDSIATAYNEIDAEITAFKNRTHLGNSKNKLKVLSDLKMLLGDIRDGNPRVDFPEAKSVGDVIKQYLQATDPITGISAGDCLKKPLNAPFKLFKSSTPKSQQLVDTLIESYANVPLPAYALPIESVEHDQAFAMH